jgi:plastocyanin
VKRSLRWVPALALASVLAMMSTASGAVLVRGVSTSNGFRWRPKVVEINTGTRVKWKAVSGTHNVTDYKGNWNKSTTISAGETTGFTFNNSGVYKFRCTLHSNLSNGVCSGMCGKVVVG